MRAINRLLEASLINKYQKYIREKLLPEISRYTGLNFNLMTQSVTSYGFNYRGVGVVDDKYIDVILKFTTNSLNIEPGDAFILDLIANGRSFQTSLEGKNVRDDLDALTYAFDMASRRLDINLSLEDDKFED